MVNGETNITTKETVRKDSRTQKRITFLGGYRSYHGPYIVREVLKDNLLVTVV